jgi:hypothetical protein
VVKCPKGCLKPKDNLACFGRDEFTVQVECVRASLVKCSTITTVLEKANPSRGGGAKPWASLLERWPGCRKEVPKCIREPPV